MVSIVTTLIIINVTHMNDFAIIITRERVGHDHKGLSVSLDLRC